MRIKNIRIWELAVIAALISSGLSAEVPPEGSVGDGGRKELKEAAGTPNVQQELESPDGVALQLLPNGGFRIFARGSGTYDFNESDEIRGATSDATLRAKAAIARFLRERIHSREVMSNTSSKIKKLNTSSGEAAKNEVSKVDVQTRIEEISSHADEVLSGLVVVSSVKKPVGSGGEVQVTMGWSSKTRGIAEAMRAGKPLPSSGVGAAGNVKNGTNTVGTLIEDNSPKRKESGTDL
jgi:hypothetical protein